MGNGENGPMGHWEIQIMRIQIFILRMVEGWHTLVYILITDDTQYFVSNWVKLLATLTQTVI